MFTAVLKRAHHLSGARLIQSVEFIQMFKIRFNIILLYMPRFSKWIPFPTKILYALVFLPNMTHDAPVLSLACPNNDF